MTDPSLRHQAPAGGFRLRGTEITRLEAFSDAVFAFALTLLVVSLEVPTTFNELMVLMSRFPAFALCLAMLTWVWWEHQRFFRKYGLQDGVTVVLNGVLLFLILFYVYPLKFLFTMLVGEMLGLPHSSEPAVQTVQQVRMLMIVYGLGFVAVFVLFALLHLRALSRRAALDLTPLERFDTLGSAQEHCVTASVGLVSVFVAAVAPPAHVGMSGLVYFLLGPLHYLAGRRHRLRRDRLFGPPPAAATD